ncbi:MAG: TonB-dependent receptor, partial [Thiohalobacterales bacterium]|nr:TonB-dependent receptor [Thiohalobacterales bacterium]
LGYRGSLSEWLTLDASWYYHEYDRLLSTENSFFIEQQPLPAHAVVAGTFDNQTEAETYGFEVAANIRVSSSWQISSSYSWLRLRARNVAGSTDEITVQELEGGAPEVMYQLRSRWDIGSNVQLDVAAFYTDDIGAGTRNGFEQVPDYTRVDVRVGWSPSEAITLGVFGQNLLDDSHVEIVSADIQSSQLPRVFGAEVILEF